MSPQFIIGAVVVVIVLVAIVAFVKSRKNM